MPPTDPTLRHDHYFTTTTTLHYYYEYYLGKECEVVAGGETGAQQQEDHL